VELIQDKKKFSKSFLIEKKLSLKNMRRIEKGKGMRMKLINVIEHKN
jgi:hypothetical protein